MDRNPHEIAERRVELSAEYGAKSERLKEILEVKATGWKELRDAHKYNKDATDAWNASSLGIEEMKLKIDLKVIEKKLSAARTYLEVMSGEARNQW
jgi:hypothetical protein